MGSSSSRNLDASRLRSSRRERGHASDACRNQSEGRVSRGRQTGISSGSDGAAIFRLDEGSSLPRDGGSRGRDQIQIEISRGSSSMESTDRPPGCSCTERGREARESVIVEVENPQSSSAARSIASSFDEDKEDGLDSDEELDKLDRSGDEEQATGSSSSSSSSSSSPLAVENPPPSSEATTRQRTPQQLARDSNQFFDEIPVDLVRAVDHSGRESRRNSGRRFWDALTRAASHRRSTAPITIVAIEEIDDNGSSTSRWNFQHWRSSSDAEHTEGDRAMDWEERRRHVRSHVWALQRLSGGLQISHGHERSCPAAGQFNGHCSCETQASEDSSTRASISRIIMLAEALFEVLDEIHRQSVALSQSASMPLALLPAPDTVVNSIPVRSYKRAEEAAQCHICLVEYEEGDQIRVLPCQHEYHQACVDKWLKEVHRVCPLCRGNVCSKTIPATGNAEAGM